MQTEVEQLIGEINQLRVQYVAEVGEGRRKWPRSIKERVEQLDLLGVPAKQISKQTGIGYETILQWRFQRRRQEKKLFHQVQIAEPSKIAAKIDTVTVPKVTNAKKIVKIGTVTVTTPGGFKIEVLDIDSALRLLKELEVR